MSDTRHGKVRLRLYVTGGTVRAQRAVLLTRRLCNEAWGEDAELAIVDVLDQPALAERDRVIATPTLIREFPPPVRRVIGDPGDGAALRAMLDLPAVEPADSDA